MNMPPTPNLLLTNTSSDFAPAASYRDRSTGLDDIRDHSHLALGDICALMCPLALFGLMMLRKRFRNFHVTDQRILGRSFGMHSWRPFL